jgi:uncharacterized protein YbjT (DUF2867 family)
MNVAIVGATGTVGREAADALKRRGHAVQALSRANGVDLRSSLGDALLGAEVVVHAAGGDRDVLVGGSARLLAAAPHAHHVLISAVGAGRVPARRFRDKAAQEEVVRSGGAPFTILRATPVHARLAGRLRRAARCGVLPSGPLRLQPIAAAEVGGALADIAEAEPSGAVARLAGPEILTLTELGRQWRAATGAHALALPLPLPGAVGRALRAGALTDPGAWRGRVRFADWLGPGTAPLAVAGAAA